MYYINVQFYSHTFQEAKFLSFFFLIYFVFCSHACICTFCMSDANGDQKRVFDPLVLELWLAVSHYVYAGTEPQFSARAARALKLLSHLSGPSRNNFQVLCVFSVTVNKTKLLFCYLVGCFVFLICILCVGVYCWSEETIDALELVKQMIASCCMGARNWTGSSRTEFIELVELNCWSVSAAFNHESFLQS